MFPSALLALVSLASADDSFFAGTGPEKLSMAALEAGSTVVGRTGGLVARVGDPDALLLEPGVASVERLRGGVVRIRLRKGADDLALARTLHARPDVEWVHPDLLLNLRPASVPDDPLYVDEWHLDNTGQGGRTPDVDINAVQAWQYATGAGVTIAVLDSGVQLDHPDLVVTAGHDYVDRDEDPSPGTDSSGPHGTGVAGIAAARGNNGVGVAGVAWEADIYAIRLIGGSTSTSDLYDAFAEAVDAGAGVLSNSWGFYGCDGVPNVGAFSDMFKYADDVGRDGLGSLVVFAAGNDNCDNSDDAMLSNGKAIVVAALEWWDERASYSNYSDDMDIAAPTSVLTTDLSAGGYGSYGGDDAYWDGFSGTSGATPVVSGVVALMLEANPRITAKQVRDVLCRTAVRNDLDDADWDEDGWSPYYGCGRIDAGAAVAAVANTAPSAPVPSLTRETVYEGRAVLAWEPAVDADDDVQGYSVSWWLDGTDESGANTQSVAGTWVDLGDKLEAGDVVHWTVTARDVWGDGLPSAVVSFSVVVAPMADADEGDGEEEGEPAAACASARGEGIAGIGAAFWAIRRRRRG